MRSSFEFILDKEFEYNIKFVFSTKCSHLHVLDINKPTFKNNIYKNYYCWYIEALDEEEAEILFDMQTDECSILLDLSKYIKHTIKSKQKFKQVYGFGQPTSVWEIKYIKGYSMKDLEWVEDQIKDYIEYTVFNSLTNQGYRFDLSIEESKNFTKWLDMINNYMLQHKEEI